MPRVGRVARRGLVQRRGEVLGVLDALPRAQTVSHEEAMALLERRRLWGRGLAWVDTHLLASAVVEGRARAGPDVVGVWCPSGPKTRRSGRG